MKSTIYVALLSAVLGAAAMASLQACGQSDQRPAQQEQSGMQGESPSDQLHAIMMRPMTNMNVSGDVDRDFATLMIPHHQGAIDMARIELAHGKNEELKKMSQNIIDSQSKEIEVLKRHAN